MKNEMVAHKSAFNHLETPSEVLDGTPDDRLMSRRYSGSSIFDISVKLDVLYFASSARQEIRSEELRSYYIDQMDHYYSLSDKGRLYHPHSNLDPRESVKRIVCNSVSEMDFIKLYLSCVEFCVIPGGMIDRDISFLIEVYEDHLKALSMGIDL